MFSHLCIFLFLYFFSKYNYIFLSHTNHLLPICLSVCLSVSLLASFNLSLCVYLSLLVSFNLYLYLSLPPPPSLAPPTTHPSLLPLHSAFLYPLLFFFFFTSAPPCTFLFTTLTTTFHILRKTFLLSNRNFCTTAFFPLAFLQLKKFQASHDFLCTHVN